MGSEAKARRIQGNQQVLTRSWLDHGIWRSAKGPTALHAATCLPDLLRAVVARAEQGCVGHGEQSS